MYIYIFLFIMSLSYFRRTILIRRSFINYNLLIFALNSTIKTRVRTVKLFFKNNNDSYYTLQFAVQWPIWLDIWLAKIQYITYLTNIEYN